MTVEPSFVFTTCQVRAEPALKRELSREWPDFRLAYSRPGFLTFKLPAGHGLQADFDLHSVFARAYGFSLGKVTGKSIEELAAAAAGLVGDFPFEALHLWQRDARPPGHRGYEPGITPAAREAEAALRQALHAQSMPPRTNVRPGKADADVILDCVLVESDEWWLGWHRASGAASHWPGGFCPIELPPDAVSRAFLKMEDALRWSGLPVKTGQRAAEIGCAPGGASQALLNRGLLVTGIDPAEVHPAVLANPHFTHVKKRGADLRRREFRKTRWLFVDVNMSPTYTLDTTEAIVTHREVDVRGLLLTLKLLDWELADHLPEYLSRVRSWGYDHVRARQLGTNRQEVCVAAKRR